jgi:hypothetical protein
MMNMRDQWKMAFSAARLATCVDTHGDKGFVARIPSKDLRDAVEYAATPFTDPLARHIPGRIFRIQSDKRDRVANPWKHQSFNCRCVATPIEVNDGTHS